MRLKIETYGCMLSLAARCRSEDPFTQVGAVGLSETGKVIGVCYNGLSPKMEVPAWMHDPTKRDKKSRLFIHAEQNLLGMHRRGDIHTLCLNYSPCDACAASIIAHGIKKVVYIWEYKAFTSKDIFDFHGVKISKLPLRELSKIKSFFQGQIEKICQK